MNRDFAATGLIPATGQTFSIARRPVRVVVASITQPLTEFWKARADLK